MEAERDDNWAADKADQSSRAREDWLHVQRLREGDAEAGHVLVQRYYPGVYHYLLYLTGRPELAEDLTQETFLQAWRRLDTFAGRAPLRVWLHRIAYREFLQAVRRPRPVAPLEEVAEVAVPSRADWTEAIVLQEAIRRLPSDQQQVVVLHYLQGYDCQEIGQILRAPIGTVKYWLSLARTHLQRELGEGDLSYLNEAAVPMRQWAWLPLDQMHALETRLGFSDSVPMSGRTEETMERREFLRQAAAGAAGLMLSEAEKEVVDERLTHKVTLDFKGMALSDVCEHLRTETGVRVAAGASVADEKVTLFCQKMPLREVMRQLSRPFGYTWLRSGTPGQYRYELVQDLRSQLLEEELRNRDRNAALVALEREIERYRPYLHLSPDEALARSKSAPAEEKHLLELLAGYGWGPIQVYFRLSSQELAAARAGQELTFSAEPMAGERPLPPDIGRGVLQSFRDIRFRKDDRGFVVGPEDLIGPGGLPATAVAEARALATVRIRQGEPGQFWFGGEAGVFNTESSSAKFLTSYCQDPYAVGRGSHALPPTNAVVNAKLSHEPSLRPTINLHPESCCRRDPAPSSSPTAAGGNGGSRSEPKVTSADVLEAVHRATGLPIAADYYTRLYPAEAVSVRNQPLFEALNQLSDTMHLRWHKDGPWLQFRSTSFYDDRIKEVPNRLLVRWEASRRQHGYLTLNDLCEIAQLSDAQLDAAEMAEGARECFDLVEWHLGRDASTRPHLRFLVGFTPAQRQEATSATGLQFAKMPLTQQQQFLSLALAPGPRLEEPLHSLEELTGAALRMEYTQPGGFQWGDPGLAADWTRWVVPLEPGPQGRRLLRPPIRERTREAALQALRQLDPKIRDAAVHVRGGRSPDGAAAPVIPLEAQIFPTQLGLTIIYFQGTSNARSVRVLHHGINGWHRTW
jgi:RNA polymerase sigma-70 factor (ECF subfamily)